LKARLEVETNRRDRKMAELVLRMAMITFMLGIFIYAFAINL
jgi:hypothetical protein